MPLQYDTLYLCNIHAFLLIYQWVPLFCLIVFHGCQIYVLSNLFILTTCQSCKLDPLFSFKPSWVCSILSWNPMIASILFDVSCFYFHSRQFGLTSSCPYSVRFLSGQYNTLSVPSICRPVCFPTYMHRLYSSHLCIYASMRTLCKLWP